ncbi:beta strand repeat-containing protein, partial [Flavobacterium luteum]
METPLQTKSVNALFAFFKTALLIVKQMTTGFFISKITGLLLIPINDVGFSKIILKKKPLNNSFSVAILLLSLLFGITASAQTNTWDGSSSSNWNTAANWSLNLVPTSAHDVVIPNGVTATITINTSAVCKTYTMNGGNTANTVTISSGNSLTVSGAVLIGAGTGNNDDKILDVASGSLSCTTITVTATGSNQRNSGITLTTGTVTASGTITMGDVNDIFTFSNAGFLNVGGNMSGGTFTASTGTVEYYGNGSGGTTANQTVGAYTYNNLTLSGSGIKTFSATSTINTLLSIQGTVTVAGTTPIYSTAILEYKGSAAQITSNVELPSTVTVNLIIDNSNGVTLNASKSSFSGSLTVTAGSILALSTFNLASPTSTLLECGAVTGSSITGSGVLTLGGDVTVTDAGTGTSGATIAAPITMASTRNFIVANDTFNPTNSTAVDLSISSIVSGAGGLTKQGAGTMDLSALNTYNGTTTVTAGILRASNNTVVTNTNGAFGNSASAASNIILNGGTIQFNTATFSKTITVAVTNSGLDGYGTSRIISAPITKTAAGTFNLNIGGTTVASAEGQDLTLSGLINNTSAGLGLTKIGTSTAIISGASNSYSGGTTITSGILRVSAVVASSGNGALGNGGTISLNGGTLQSNIASFDRGLTVSATNSTIDAFGVNSSFTGSINQNVAATFNLNVGGTTAASAEGQQLTFSSAINNSSGTLGLTKIGSSTVILSAGNGYTGLTTVSAGTLQYGVNSAIATGAVTVSGGTLSMLTFTDTVGAVTLTSGAITGTTGALTAASYAVESGTISKILAGTGGLTKSNLGTVTLSGANTYTGGNNISAGTLSINSTTALGAVANNLTIASGAFANIVSNVTVANLTLGGLGTAIGTWGFTGSGATFINTTNFTTTISGVINVSNDSRTAPTATLVVSNSPATYSGSAQSATVSISASSVPGVVTTILTGAAASQTTAATYAVTASFVPTNTANYSTLTGLSAGNFVINKVNLTITATGPTKTYGTALTAGASATNFTAVGAIPGQTVTSVTLTPNAAGLSATTAAGLAYVVTPSAPTGTGGFLAANYNITFNAFNGTVGQANLTITATGPTKTYGTALTAGASATNFTAVGAIPGEAVTSVTLTPNAAGLSATTAAGLAYVVTPSAPTGIGGFLAANYNITFNAFNGTVGQANLTITATGPTKTYGTALTTVASATNFTAVGAIPGQTVTSVTLTPNAAGLSATTATGLAYVVTPSAPTGTGGFLAANYNITFNAFNGTVGQANLTVTATGPTKTYGTALTAGASSTNFTAVGAIPGEAVTSVTLTPNAAGLSATTAAGLAYVVTPSAPTGTGGFLAANYNITFNAFNGTVGQANLTITATGPTKTYGTALTAGASATNFTAVGAIPGQTITSVTLTPNVAGLSATTAAGLAYVVTPSAPTGTGGFLAANYNITFNAFNGTVGQANLTITATGPTKTYGTALTT